MSSESFLDTLKTNGVEFNANAVSESQTLFNTQFFKDKKHRCYFIFSLETTKYNPKVLSARLGLGKSGLVKASAELVEAIFQGDATLTGLSAPAAAETLLLVDAGAAALPADASITLPLPGGGLIALSGGGAAIEKLIKTSLGLRQAPIVTDLLADPKIDRENPPDLKAAADAASPVPSAVPSEAQAEGADAAKATSTAPAPAPAKKAAKAAPTKPTQVAKPTEGVSTWIQNGNVNAISNYIVEKVSSAVAPDASAPVVPASLINDLEMLLRALHNNAYSAGFDAGKSLPAGRTGPSAQR